MCYKILTLDNNNHHLTWANPSEATEFTKQNTWKIPDTLPDTTPRA